MKTYLGLAHGFHDAAMAVIENDSIIYAGHSERYSRIKNDKNIVRDWVINIKSIDTAKEIKRGKCFMP